MKKITSRLVNEQQRLCFLPHYFGDWMLEAESFLYSAMSFLCKEYKGAYWHFYKLSNGGFYMAPELSEILTLSVAGNYYQGEVSADTAGIISTLFTLSYIFDKSELDKFGEFYHLLLDYAEQHQEAKAIFAAID